MGIIADESAAHASSQPSSGHLGFVYLALFMDDLVNVTIMLCSSAVYHMAALSWSSARIRLSVPLVLIAKDYSHHAWSLLRHDFFWFWFLLSSSSSSSSSTDNNTNNNNKNNYTTTNSNNNDSNNSISSSNSSSSNNTSSISTSSARTSTIVLCIIISNASTTAVRWPLYLTQTSEHIYKCVLISRQ